MIKKTTMNDLELNGSFSKAVLAKIVNTRSGMAVSLENKPCLCFKTEDGNDIQRFSLDDCMAENTGEGSGVYYHQATGMKINVEWRNVADDAIACNVAFNAKNRSVTLREIEFSLPGYLQFSTKKQDALVYPDAGGVKIENPAEEFLKAGKYRTGTWKDRTMWLREEGFHQESEDEDVHTFFDGKSPSMMWVDYYGEKGGLYFASHDRSFEKTVFTVTVSKKNKGLRLRTKKIFNRFLDKWDGDFVIGLHEGDWHRGADIYRSFYRANGPAARKAPDYIRASPGIVCHYDFKWQNGDINHRYKDIPLLYEEAQKHRFNNIMIAGWNVGGFDTMYPNFRPDPALGSEEELINAVSEVKGKGGKVFFYVNAYSYDKKSPDYKEFGEEWAVRDIAGKAMETKWGENILAGMCNSTDGWRAKVKGNIKYLIETIGANGVYIDQLSVTPKECYSKSHEHTASWVMNNCSMIKEVREELGAKHEGKLFLFSEHLSDVLASQLDSQLIQTAWLTGVKYAFPELFRYTFPEALLTDMVLPKPWALNPCEVEEDHVYDIICRQFVANILFWVYDHVLVNPRMGEFFASAVALKDSYKTLLTEAEFKDDVEIKDCPDKVKVKSYQHPSGKIIFTVWNQTGEEGFFSLKKEKSGTLSSDDLSGSVYRDVIIKNGNSIKFSKARLSVVVLDGNPLPSQK